MLKQDPNISEQNSKEVEIIKKILRSQSYYDILAVRRTASTEDVRKSYFKRSKLVHPDKCSHTQAKEAFFKLNQAYETLKNPKSRRAYELSYEIETGHSSSQRGAAAFESVLHVLKEFASGNFNKVVDVLGEVAVRNPELKNAHEYFRDKLELYNRYKEAGRLRMEIVKEELDQLFQLQQDAKSLYFFDVLGRSQNSLRTTILVLKIFKKQIYGTESNEQDESDSDLGDHSTNTERSSQSDEELGEMANTRDDPVEKYVETLISALETVCSEFQQLDNNHAIFSIQDIASVNHITVFITQPFPSGYAATVHFLWPGTNSKWQVLGLITNDKPSALFKLNGNKAIDDQESRARMWDSAASGLNQCAQLGICVEPVELAEHEVAQAKAGNDNARLLGSNMSLTEDTNPELRKVRIIVEKILNHLQNYIMSFVKVDPSGNEIIPANAFQQWIQAIQRKTQDQSFLDTQ